MSSELTASELETLSTKAIAAKTAAYCPYSNFHVGACVMMGSGEFFPGANIENASYPVGTCAERVALATAVMSGHKFVKAVAVSSDISPGTSPCGMCRQFMREFCTDSVPVYMYGKDGKYVLKTMGELLPDSFSPADLAATR